MTKLNLDPNIDRTDAFYAALIAAHEGLTPEESHAMNARLILILANQIGDNAVLAQAISAAQLRERE